MNTRPGSIGRRHSRPPFLGNVAGAVFLTLACEWLRAAHASQSGAPSALTPFFDRVSASGRAEVRLERRFSDPEGERRVRGRVILEPPGFAKLEFDATGEKITLRPDGGEWLQPALRQCVRMGPDRSRAALSWWELLLGRERGRFRERRLPDGRLLIVRGEGEGVADSAWVTLEGDLPARLEVAEEAGGRSLYRLSSWRFSHARGRADFMLSVPRGWEDVSLP
ncbi:MAG: hypothetical protein HYR73_07575 [Candidatus Eisenbacteria bacterium]|nr:hypothetical protein [Candidatus Eisenbacteria bacterium]